MSVNYTLVIYACLVLLSFNSFPIKNLNIIIARVFLHRRQTQEWFHRQRRESTLFNFILDAMRHAFDWHPLFTRKCCGGSVPISLATKLIGLGIKPQIVQQALTGRRKTVIGTVACTLIKVCVKLNTDCQRCRKHSLFLFWHLRKPLTRCSSVSSQSSTAFNEIHILRNELFSFNNIDKIKDWIALLTIKATLTLTNTKDTHMVKWAKCAETLILKWLYIEFMHLFDMFLSILLHLG